MSRSALAETRGMVLSRPIRVGVPFTGIDSVKRAMVRKGIRGETNNIIETDEHVMSYLSAMQGRTISPRDIREVIRNKTFEDCDFCVLGTPCQGFTRAGKQQGFADPRSLLFLDAIDFCALHRQSGYPLKMVVFENSPAILERDATGKVPMDRIAKKWKATMKGWTPLVPWIMNARDYDHALDRGRCLLVSVPAVFKSILDESSPCCPLPFSTPPKSVAKPRMVDALERVGTPIDEQSFPKAPCMGKNWAHWVKQWALEMNDLPDGTTGIVDIARDPTKAYAVKMTYDRAPSLTRKNYDLAVFGQPSNSKVGPQGKLMTLRERCGVMGFDVDDFVGHLSPRQTSAAVGNAIAVNVVGAVLEWAGAYMEKMLRVASRKPPPRMLGYGSADDDLNDDSVSGRAAKKPRVD